MAITASSRRFLASTRGRIVRILRRAGATVNDLAAALELTDNAVRAHLTALERDGLVQATGTRRGVRKPHQTYGLTAEAEDLFPKAYGPLLCELLRVLSDRLPPAGLESAMREVGRRLAVSNREAVSGASFDERVQRVVDALGELGGLAEREDEAERVIVRGKSCPLAAAVRCQPAACLMAETLVSEIAGEPARECCERGDTPRCAFEIARVSAE
jgi:predicted ArsR family transcriptional regulator